MKILSKRAIEKAERPEFLSTPTERESFLNMNKPGTFCTSKSENGQFGGLQLFGLQDLNELEPKINSLKYVSTLEGAEIAFIETFIELIHKNYKADQITIKEIDHYLREKNSLPSFENTNIFYPLFVEVQNLIKSAFGPSQRSPEDRQSPTVVTEYKNLKEKTGELFSDIDYLTLSLAEKRTLIDKIIDNYILPPLALDGGGIDIVFMDESMVVFEYLGACTQCRYSLTSTIDYIQKVLRLETGHAGLLVMTDS